MEFTASAASSLVERKSVRLDDRRNGRAFYICKRRFGIVKDLIGCRRDRIFLHKLLCEHLGAFDLRRRRGRTERGYPRLGEGIDRSEHKRIVRRHNGVVYGVVLCEIHDRGDILRADRHALRVRGNSAVSRERVYLIRVGRFFKGLDDCVFAAAAADYKYIHGILPFGQWWNSLMPVKHIVMPNLSQAAMTLSSRTLPPGCAT